MLKRALTIGVLALAVVALTAPSALAFRCPKLIAAGRRLAEKTSGPDRAKAVRLLNEAEAAHKGASGAKGHITAMQKATDAVAILAK